MFLTARLGAASRATARESEPNAMRFLVIDHDPVNAELIISVLAESDPATNCVAVRFAEAEAAMVSGTYDAYVISGKPPANDWIPLIESTRNEATGPVVLLIGTNDGDDEIIERAATAGDVECIDWSVDTPRALGAALRNAVDK